MKRFYGKDLLIVRGHANDYGDFIYEVTYLNHALEPANTSEMIQVIERRAEQEYFKHDQMFRQGTVQIKDELCKIRDALLKKDGIVSSEKQE